MSSDLLKIWAKKPKLSQEPPKSKYMIESANIKQIIKGHGTEAFAKTKGLFRSSKEFFIFTFIITLQNSL